MKRDSAGAVLVIVVMLLLGGALALGRKKPPEPSRKPSTLVASPRGLKAIYLALERSDIPVARLAESYENLEGRTGVLVVASPSTEVSRGELAALERWVAGGNSALFLLRAGEEEPPVGGHDDALVDFLRLRRARAGASTRAVAPFPFVAAELLKGASMGRPAGFVRASDARPMTSLYERADASLLLSGEIGDGRVVVMPTTAPFENDRLLQGTNLPLAAALLESLRGGETVIFDEFHHGLSVPAWTTLVRSRATWTLAAQILLAGTLFVLGGLRRTEPLRSPPRTHARSRAEHVRAMAALYAAGRHTAHVARIVLATHDAARRRGEVADGPEAPRAALARAAAGHPSERELLGLVRALPPSRTARRTAGDRRAVNPPRPQAKSL